AAKMETKMFENLQILIPGMLGTTKLDMPKQTIHMGKPCAGCKPLRFKGYFKYFPVNGDSCVAQLTLWKYNTNLHKRDTIANVRMIVTDTVDTYTPFDLEVDYLNTYLIPDTMMILFVSSAGFNFNNLTGCVGQVGSTMFVDDVSVEYPAGITEALMPEIDVKTYPNPAADKVIFTLDSCPENLTMEVLDQQGKWITKFPVQSCDLTLNTSSYSSGTYYFRLMQDKYLMSTGVFIINN
ncbi:MAG: T9SS type A sorting domain-containing protein, partial [Bacteroidetes bacterium]|nr:T9SS type A sorting domain-containing protein [Bacteroidota bacterium]